jgi:glycosyltransferase involved in cell wall biosynthesis
MISTGSPDRRKTVDAIVLNSFVNDSRVLKTCRSLADAGYQVRVIALHDGSAGLPEVELVHGLPVHRVRLRTKHWWRSRPLQFVKYVEFLVRVASKYRGSAVYHCHDLNALPAGLLCRTVSRATCSVIYDAHEHESERAGFSWAMRLMTRVIERCLIGFADRVITVSPSIAAEYQRLYRIAEPIVVYNAPYFAAKVFDDSLRRRFGISKDAKIYLYQGALTAGRGLSMLLRIFSSLGPDLCIVFVGSGELEQNIEAAARRHGNIYHIPYVDPLELWRLTMAADYGIVLIENVCRSYYYCLPNKLFEFMMAELPVLVSDMLELKRFVEEYGVGLVSRVDEVAVRTAIAELANCDRDRVVANIRRVKTRFTWETQEKKLLEVYAGLSVQAARSVR